MCDEESPIKLHQWVIIIMLAGTFPPALYAYLYILYRRYQRGQQESGD